MFDIAWSEFLIIAVVALVVIGPKDLPKALSTLGKWIARARSMARDFQNNVDDMVRQAELEDLRKQVQQARNFNLNDELEKSIDPDGGLRKSLTVDDFTSPAKGDAPQPATTSTEAIGARTPASGAAVDTASGAAMHTASGAAMHMASGAAMDRSSGAAANISSEAAADMASIASPLPPMPRDEPSPDTHTQPAPAPIASPDPTKDKQP
ncbi:Sec-independent protein translocase protein TatB [Niveispirillum fermenti]|uniref:Sec-independent protein translocase protein TatB n=1 Tax=Niveispirillum fermenti TaxID=1233113 RepID=UPI003A896B23